MKVLLAGDVHGNLNNLQELIEAAQDTDCVRILQLGDFGWWPHTPEGARFIEDAGRLLERAYLSLSFIDGNHENHPALWRTAEKDPLTEEGFRVVGSCLRYIPRGHAWEWDGVKFIGLGGADSIDKQYRIHGASWWPEELTHAFDAELAVAHKRCDVLLTHDAPALPPGCDPALDTRQSKKNRRLIAEVAAVLQPHIHVHGHFHTRYHRDGVFGLDCDGSGDDQWAVLHLEDGRASLRW